MPLFDRDNPVSEELAVAVAWQELMAGQTYWQALAETTNFNEALAKIEVGGADEPEDGLQFRATELAKQHIHARIFRVDGTHIVRPGGFDRPDEQGDLQCIVRRQIRESEKAQDAFLFFWDRTSRLVRDMQLAIETTECPRLLAITEPQGPYRNGYKTKTAQGDYLWTTFIAKWGDNIEQ